VAGYHLVFWALRSHAKSDLLHRLDADSYSSEEVAVLTVPVLLPYPVYAEGYQRVSGEVEYNGEYYQLVKQKIENDTLFMVCVKDHKQKSLDRTMNEYTNLTNNLPASAKRTMDLMGKLFKDFMATNFVAPSINLVLKYDILFSGDDFLVIQQAFPIDSPPPEHA
jgi:hypothetical protein